LAYFFKPDESTHAAVRRIAAEELDLAIDQLEGRAESNRDEAIHEARKSVKKVRGILRLMRLELGATYALENQRLRAASNKLSDFRDAGAMLEIFDRIRDRHREEWGNRPILNSLRCGLLQAKARYESGSMPEVLLAVADELRNIRDDVTNWPLQNDGFTAIAPGVELTYRAGRQSMRRALREPSAQNYHDWRKRVKDHWYHVRLIGRVCGDGLAFYQKNLKDLEADLGDDHNLTVLRQKICSEPGVIGRATDVGFFLNSVENDQSRLRSEAALLGQHVYEDSPKVLVGELRGLWDAWVKDRERINSSLPVTG